MNDVSRIVKGAKNRSVIGGIYIYIYIYTLTKLSVSRKQESSTQASTQEEVIY